MQIPLLEQDKLTHKHSHYMNVHTCPWLQKEMRTSSFKNCLWLQKKVQSSPLTDNLTGLYICKSGERTGPSEQGNQSED